MSSATPRLLALSAGFLLIGSAAFLATRQALDIAPGKSGLALGMRWLQHAYDLDDATFALIQEEHLHYFRECEQRCHELNNIGHHFLSALGSPTRESDLDAIQELEEIICHDCRMAMIEHVHQVGALMPEDARLRFIADFRTILLPSGRPRGRASR